MNEDTTLLLDCSGHFADSDGVIVNCVPAIQYHFTIQKINDFLFFLIPEKDYFGTVTVTVSAQDDSGVVRSAAFYLTVKNVDAPPVFFQNIRDTSIHCNADLRVQLKPILKDVDDPLYKLTLTATVPNYLTYYRDDTALVFQPMGFIDTARITIKAMDSAGFWDTTSFLLYTNKPVAFDSIFTIRCAIKTGYNYCIYYAWIGNSNDSTVGMFGLIDKRLFYDSYSINGRKCRQTQFLNLPDCDYLNGSTSELTKLADNRFLLIYQYGTAVESWRHLLLDSNLTILNTYQPSVYNNSVHAVTETLGKIFVFGRHEVVSPNCLYVDVFDTNLNYMRSDTVSKQVFWAYSIHIFPTNQGYTVFWTDSVIDNQFDRQLFAESFTADGKIATPKKRILPYIQRNSTHPINFSPSATIIRRKSGKFLVLWRMDDAVSQSGGSFGGIYRPQLYALEVDSDLIVSNTYSTIISDSVAFRRNIATYAYDWGNKIMIVWRNSGGNGDPIYMYYRAFNPDLQPITSTFTDSLSVTEYRVVNDSIIFRLNRSDPQFLKAAFRNNLLNSNATGVSQNRQSRNSVQLKPSDIQRYTSVKVYDLLGRKYPLNKITGQKNRFSGLPQGVLILGLDSGGQLKLKKIMVQQ
jgi:hypothetical protein